MQRKAKPRADIAEALKGATSLELTERCPDQRTTFPDSPCTNVDCDWRIECEGYFNCTFVAGEVGAEIEGHPLQLIGEFMGITREGVRQIEKKALLKLREAAGLDLANHEAIYQSVCTSGTYRIDAPYEGSELEDEADLLPAMYGRELGERG